MKQIGQKTLTVHKENLYKLKLTCELEIGELDEVASSI